MLRWMLLCPIQESSSRRSKLAPRPHHVALISGRRYDHGLEHNEDTMTDTLRESDYADRARHGSAPQDPEGA